MLLAQHSPRCARNAGAAEPPQAGSTRRRNPKSREREALEHHLQPVGRHRRLALGIHKLDARDVASRSLRMRSSRRQVRAGAVAFDLIYRGSTAYTLPPCLRISP
jgi:hypothetical protein